MATSDLQSKLRTLLPNASFTLFAPADASLFALDMIQTASSYIDTLRVRVVPLRPPIYLIRLHTAQISLRTVSTDRSPTRAESPVTTGSCSLRTTIPTPTVLKFQGVWFEL